MYFKQSIGKLGEDIACLYLEKNNYKIIKRNFRCKQGEIDIIVYDETTEEIVFVEVKTRTGSKYGEPRDSVSKIKQKHIKSVASYYNYMYGLYDIPSRYDVIEILINNSNYKIKQIKQAFQ